MVEALVGSWLGILIPLVVAKSIVLVSTRSHGSVPIRSPSIRIVIRSGTEASAPWLSLGQECWLKESCQEVDEVLGATQISDLFLIFLVAFFVLSLLVVVFLVSDVAHLFGVAILDKQWILRFEKHIFGELLGILTLVLFLKVNESLLRVLDDLNLRHFSLASGREVDLELFFGGSNREVFDEETEVHNRLLVLELHDFEFFGPHSSSFGFTDEDIRQFNALYLFDFDLIMLEVSRPRMKVGSSFGFRWI